MVAHRGHECLRVEDTGVVEQGPVTHVLVQGVRHEPLALVGHARGEEVVRVDEGGVLGTYDELLVRQRLDVDADPLRACERPEHQLVRAVQADSSHARGYGNSKLV